MNDDKSRLPHIAKYKPYYFELSKGKRYMWCSCGLSKKQPFCDGSHAGTDFLPIKVVGQYDGQEVLFCGCKHSQDQPFCDGAHNNLRGTYETDDPNSESNSAIPEKPSSPDGRSMLDGGCFVASMDRLPLQQQGSLKYGPIISAANNAIYQSQYYFEVAGEQSPIISFGDADVVIFFKDAEGQLLICNHSFQITPCSGAYVRGGESFQLLNQSDTAMKCFVSVCPVDAEITWLEEHFDAFASEHPDRVVLLDEENRTPMADRFFQLLVDGRIGCEAATQFIGEIPHSKALLHRHLYEESLIVVSGHGQMWTENVRTRVNAGDVIFLPRKQVHSLECTAPEGMIVAGVIHPGDNPGINY